MSVVIAARYRDGITLVADTQGTSMNNKQNNIKKIKQFELSNTGIGVVGYLRDCNIVRILDEIIKPRDILNKVDIDEEYVIRKVVPKLIEHMQENKRTLHSESGMVSMASQMLFVTNKRMFEIGSDFSVAESDRNYAVIGCGEEKVRGYMSLVGDTSNKTAIEITNVLVGAIRKACEDDVYINDAYDIYFFREEK